MRDAGITDLIIVGLTTDHCVSATARMASDLGFAVTVVSDGTAAHERHGADGRRHTAEDVHAIHLASLHGEFGRVRTTLEVLDEVAGSDGPHRLAD